MTMENGMTIPLAVKLFFKSILVKLSCSFLDIFFTYRLLVVVQMGVRIQFYLHVIHLHPSKQ